ncbi:MAG: (2Fe-2S)-binding protein [SAR324 cluster bacterium]|nr:(2Fe-2S)-binding protein [SAR324 cluster bacterium]
MGNYFFIDGKKIPFEPGESILKAALRAGFDIPHYCYHPSLSTPATCRMCLIDVVDSGNGKGLPTLQTSCTTLAKADIKISAQGEKVVRAREGVLEFLLVNHPLDCVICDQAGECTLQDFAFEYGSGVSIVNHEKRVYGLRKIGSFLELERNRCIHCTRCVRFSQEITGNSELGTFGRGHQLTVDTFIDKPLSDQFQGNLADICPVGAITLKDFRFKKRVWKLKSVPSICDRCATGCSINLDHKDGTIYRITPRENQEVNRWWMCDHGRVGFHDYYADDKLQKFYTKGSQKIDRSQALTNMLTTIKASAGSICFINTASSTLEEAYSLKLFAKLLGDKAKIYYPKPVAQRKDSDIWIDNLISDDKSPNSRGLKLLGFSSLEEESFSKIIKDSTDTIIVVGQLNKSWQTLLSDITDNQRLIQLTCLKNELLGGMGLGLPLIPVFEKSGIYVNRQGRAQKVNRLNFSNGTSLEECSLWKNLADELDPIDNDQPKDNAEALIKLAESDKRWQDLTDKKLLAKGILID